MKLRFIVTRLSVLIAPLAAALMMASPTVTHAATTILIDFGSPAADCGSYTGQTANTDPADAINNAPSGSTIILCPDVLPENGALTIAGKKLTIKRAVKDRTPTLRIDNNSPNGIEITDSTVSIDGVIIDATFNTQTDFAGVMVTRSSVTMKNLTVIAPNTTNSKSIYINETGVAKLLPVSISDSFFSGYKRVAVQAYGAAKLTVSGCYMDGTDGGRIALGSQGGVWFSGGATPGPTGTVTKNTIINNTLGVGITDSSKITVSNNIIVGAMDGITISNVGGANPPSDNIKISGNSILAIPLNGYGIYVAGWNPPPTAKNLTISGNTFTSGQFLPGSTPPYGVYVRSNVPAQSDITVTVSGNKFFGLAAANLVYNHNGNATVTVKGSISTP